MKKSLLLLVGLFIICITSCEYKYIDPIEVELPEDPVSFSQQIEPVFDDKCASCHSSTPPILTTGEAYDNLIEGNYIDTIAPESSELYEKVEGGHPGGTNTLNPTELALILKWIQEGAPNN